MYSGIIFDLLYNFLGENKKLFILINKYTNISFIAKVMDCITSFFSIYAFVLYYVVIFILAYYKIIKRYRQNQDKKALYECSKSIYHSALNIGIIYIFFIVVYTILKFSVNLPRPFCSMAQDEFISIINSENIRCLSSFPSAHTAVSVLIVYCIWHYFPKKYLIKYMSICLIIIVGVSRITLAMHYPADIIYSVPIMFVLIFIGNIFYKILQDNKLSKYIHSFIYNNIL